MLQSDDEHRSLVRVRKAERLVLNLGRKLAAEHMAAGVGKFTAVLVESLKDLLKIRSPSVFQGAAHRHLADQAMIASEEVAQTRHHPDRSYPAGPTTELRRDVGPLVPGESLHKTSLITLSHSDIDDNARQSTAASIQSPCGHHAVSYLPWIMSMKGGKVSSRPIASPA